MDKAEPPFFRTLVHREVVRSTSDLARTIVLEGSAPLPLVVRADRQTHGRGRGSHVWWSDEGSLTFTVVVDPVAHGLRPDHEPRVALAVAVAVVKAITPIVGEAAAEIRWPNDIEVSGRKLGGILPERLESPNGPRLAIGIGLNVATDLANAPVEVRGMAASLGEYAGEVADRDRLFQTILQQLPIAIDALARDNAELARRWAELDALRGRPVRIDVGTQILSGIGAGIDAEGALLLDDGKQTLRLFGGQVLRDP